MCHDKQHGARRGGKPEGDAANPRANNRHGHIIELAEGHDDPASTTFEWDIFLLCGDPNNPADGTYFGGYVWPDGVAPGRPSVVAVFKSEDDVIGA
jgi:uncharacterized protein